MAQKKSLFAITEAQLEALSEIEALDGEITPEMEELLTINESELQSKTVAYREVIADKTARNTIIDNEIKRLQAMKKSNINLIERLKSSLLNAVKIFGDITVGLVRFTTRESKTISILDESLLSKEYIITKTTKSPDKNAIKQAFKDGNEVQGAKLITNQNLRIANVK